MAGNKKILARPFARLPEIRSLLGILFRLHPSCRPWATSNQHRDAIHRRVAMRARPAIPAVGARPADISLLVLVDYLISPWADTSAFVVALADTSRACHRPSRPTVGGHGEFWRLGSAAEVRICQRATRHGQHCSGPNPHIIATMPIFSRMAQFGPDWNWEVKARGNTPTGRSGPRPRRGRNPGRPSRFPRA